MNFETSRLKGWLIGDPHLGRDFRNGTPLHRRGEREAMQLAQFKEELATPDVNMVVIVGDLFDKPFVPLTCINDAVSAVVEAAQARPDVEFVFLAGNHDRSRQIGVRGAWELFSVAVGWLPNVTVLDDVSVIDDVVFFPWVWGKSAAEQVKSLGDRPCPGLHSAVGHWDLMSFGGDDSHMAPTELLLGLNPNINLYSGHYHEEGIFNVAGINVQCTGSMQPYTHAEDPTGELYVTLTLEEALARDDLRDKCVRILLQPGEELPDIDCLQLTQKRADAEIEEVDVGEIGIGAFDLNAVLETEFAGNDVPEPVQGFIKERIGALA